MSHSKQSVKKRSAKDAFGESSTMASPLLPMFEQFRAELDEHHDRRQRVIKASSDITAASKKMVRSLNQSIPNHILNSCQQHYDTIEKCYKSIASDIQGINAYRYAHNITHANQEFMEATSFRHYLENQTLISPEDAQEKLDALCPGSSKVVFLLSDYLLGIYDMTGELMKLAITVIATSGHVTTTSSKDNIKSKDERMKILLDLRELRIHLESLNIQHSSNLGHDVSKKMDVMRASVEKVENAFYGLTVRGAERPSGWMPDENHAMGAEQLASH